MTVDYKIAIEYFYTLNDDDKSKEIYAHFGLAIYFAQVLEQQAINMIAICRQSKNKLKTNEQVNSLWDDYNLGSRTLGVLMNEIKQIYDLSHNDFKELREVLKLRNYITHDYFRFNIELFYSDTGQKKMIKDFIEFRNKAKSIDNKLIRYMKFYSDKMGLTEERIKVILEKTEKNGGRKLSLKIT